MKYIYISLVLLFALSQFSFAQNKKLIVVAEQLIPFEYHDGTKITGIDIQLIDAIFKKMNVEYEVQFGTPEERALEIIQNGKADAILTISYKNDREEFLDYPEGFSNETKPQNFMWSSEYVFFTAKMNVNKYKDLSLSNIKARNLTVGIVKGVSYSQEIWDADLNFIEVKPEDSYNLLVDGELDLFITDKTIGRFTIKSLGLDTKVGFLPHTLFSKPYTLAFRKKSNFPNLESIKNQFYEELELTKKNGFAKRVLLQYLKD